MVTFPIKPSWTINLDHPATRIASSADAKRIAVAAERPLISVMKFIQVFQRETIICVPIFIRSDQ